MQKKIIKIAISGALGKMGKCLIKEIKNFKKLQLNTIIIKKNQNIKNCNYIRLEVRIKKKNSN